MAQYADFIPENVAPKTAKRIGIYDCKGNRVGVIPLGNLAFPSVGQKLYSFGALSDIHLQYDTAQADFQKALTYLNETEDVTFTCIAGDLTTNGTATELAVYKNYVDTYSADTPVYGISGNHEGYNAGILDILETYTGYPLYYSFTHDDDVFIMCGIKSSTNAALFTTEELQWLYETLEANRNKRCFVFHHVRPQDGCGNAFGIYNYDIWGGTEQTVFESLMHHYKNAHQFHGHSHLKFYLQYGSDVANIDHIFGGWSIHIPSLSVPRDGDPAGASSRVEVYADSEGYVVDVYENGIHLRGRDFVKNEFIPIASYWLDTTLQTVEAGTYTDSTGTIKPIEPLVNLIDTVGVEDDKGIIYSNGNGETRTGYCRTGYIQFTSEGDVYRTSGVNFNTDENSYACISICRPDKSSFSRSYLKLSESPISVNCVDIIVDADGNLTITTKENWHTDGVGKYFRISGKGVGANLIVTKNQEIN